jgi:outer membrane receptor protein involved in Fe transport
VNVNDSQVDGPLFSLIPGAFGLLDHQNVPIRTSNVAVSDQHSPSARLINEFTAGMQRFSTMQNMNQPQQPLVVVTGLTIQPGNRGVTINNSTSYRIRDVFTFHARGHTLKWGGKVVNIRLVERSLGVSVLTYPSLTDFMSNSVAAATVIAGDPGGAVRTWDWDGFLQDSWRIGSRLTVDVGLRYDYFSPPFDPLHRAQPYDERTGQLASPGSSYFNPNYRDVAPRIGLAWQPLQYLVLRAGYGIFYDAYPPGNGLDITRNTLGNTTLLRQEIPSLSYPLGPFLSHGTSVIPSVFEFDRHKPDS